MELIVGILAIALVVLYIQKTNLQKQSRTSPKVQETDTENNKKIDYRKSYQSKLLLTKNEWYEYKRLKQYAEEINLQICPKVRLLDLVEPRKGDNYMSCLGKIQSKHVDFVICDKDLRVKAILELDDNSHDRKDRRQRDEFVNEVLESVGYKIIHTRSITENTLDILKPTPAPTEPTE